VEKKIKAIVDTVINMEPNKNSISLLILPITGYWLV
jgi:hypothetical protein